MNQSAKKRLALILFAGLLAALFLAMPALAEEAAEGAAASSRYYNSFWALVPPLVAIILALITKEVYSSLFIGIVVGGVLAANGNFALTLENIFNNGIVASIADPYNVGILVFLVMLGSIVALMNLPDRCHCGAGMYHCPDLIVGGGGLRFRVGRFRTCTVHPDDPLQFLCASDHRHDADSYDQKYGLRADDEV